MKAVVTVGVSRRSARIGRQLLSITHCSEPLIPTVTPFEALGGADGVRALVDRFYDLVESAPQAANLRRLHGPDLTSAREKLTLYLIGYTGGPPVYIQRFGHPMLRARHLPFPIGNQERDEWLWCMERALREHELPDDVRELLLTKLRPLADHMRNRVEVQAPGA